MNVTTNPGAIAIFETASDAKKAGYTEQLTPAQFKRFRGMNRKQRLAALAQERRAKRTR